MGGGIGGRGGGGEGTLCATHLLHIWLPLQDVLKPRCDSLHAAVTVPTMRGHALQGNYTPHNGLCLGPKAHDRCVVPRPVDGAGLRQGYSPACQRARVDDPRHYDNCEDMQRDMVAWR